MSQIVGHISQVIGPVVDVYFEGTEAEMMLPSIHDALEINRSNGKRLIVEVQQHIGENTVRTVAMDSTDGLPRGMTVHPLGGPITMPIGTQIKGRLMNVVGDSIDGMKELDLSLIHIWNNLNCLSQIVTTALFVDDAFVDASGRVFRRRSISAFIFRSRSDLLISI